MAEQVSCPKCSSSVISADRRGFSVGKGIVGGVLTGGVGLLAGFHGNSRVLITCLRCGHQWKPVKARTKKPNPEPLYVPEHTKIASRANESTPSLSLSAVRCPRCSTSAHSAYKDMVEGPLAGGQGIVLGHYKNSKLLITCHRCGHRYNPGEADTKKHKTRQEHILTKEDSASPGVESAPPQSSAGVGMIVLAFLAITLAFILSVLTIAPNSMDTASISETLSSDIVEALVTSSDDYSIYRQQFIRAAELLLSRGNCREADLRENGGFIRSTSKPGKHVYFTYCGGPHISNRVYLDVDTGELTD